MAKTKDTQQETSGGHFRLDHLQLQKLPSTWNEISKDQPLPILYSGQDSKQHTMTYCRRPPSLPFHSPQLPPLQGKQLDGSLQNKHTIRTEKPFANLSDFWDGSVLSEAWSSSSWSLVFLLKNGEQCSQREASIYPPSASVNPAAEQGKEKNNMREDRTKRRKLGCTGLGLHSPPTPPEIYSTASD